MIKLIYIAGPYSATTREGVEANIARAVALGIEVARLGAMPVIPHANTAHPEFNDAQPYDFWIDGTLELLRRCDAVIVTDDYRRSTGARGEVRDALARSQLVFTELADLAVWLEMHRKTEPAAAPDSEVVNG